MSERVSAPLISVIVPIFKVEKYLHECVDSLLNQNFQNSELLLIDDGSPDGCAEICDMYALSDPQVVVVHKKNGGLVSARKTGALMMTGEYAANVDGDDWVEGQFFTFLNNVIDEFFPDIIQFASRSYYPDSTEDEVLTPFVGYYGKERIPKEIYPHLIEDDMSWSIKPSISHHIIKRSIYQECQLNVDDSIVIGEDGACSKPAYVRAESVFFLNECICAYRIIEESMTHSKKTFDMDTPEAIGRIFDAMENGDRFSFRPQICRLVVHQLFNACSSQFYRDEPYGVTASKIRQVLKRPYYKEAIRNCSYNFKNIRGNLMLFAMKFRLTSLMKVYCLSSLKVW